MLNMAGSSVNANFQGMDFLLIALLAFPLVARNMLLRPIFTFTFGWETGIA